MYAVEPLIRDMLNKEHRKTSLTLRSTLVHFNARSEDNLHIKDKMAGPKCVHYSEVPQYIEYH